MRPGYIPRHHGTGPVRFESDSDGPIFYATWLAAKPVYDSGQVTHAMTTQEGTRDSVAWGVNIITYSIGTGAVDAADDEYTSEMDGYVAMTAAMEAAAREAFELWDDLIAVELMEMDDWPDAHITFNYSSNTGGATYARYGYWLTDNAPRSTYKLADADIWLDSSWSTHNQDSDLYLGGYGIETYLHEIGHTLGITHPGDYNGTAIYDLDATHFQDTRQYTVMSYFDADENGSGTDHVGTNGLSYGATPLLHDILVAQAIYGADMTTRTGDTVYGFNSTAGRGAFDFTININPVVAIWDAGGTDRLDASGWSTNQVLDLNGGAFSSLGAMTNNVAIAFGAVIEQAVGGGGADLIIGNAADNLLIGNGGNDTLIGGAGADQLQGGAGRDLADYAAAGAAVTVNLNSGAASGGTASGDTLDSVEDIAGTGFADTLIGNGADNSLIGRGGNDALIGGAGNDVLLGGDGADFLSGSFGTDTLDGGEGNDVLRGGEEADQIDGGGGFDWLLYNTAAASVTVNLGLGVGLAGEALGDTITGVEHLIGTAFADTLTGDASRNFLLGGAGADTLDGGDNDDTLKGQGGNDTIHGSAGIDVLIGGTGADALHGGPGGDWASYIEATAGVSASLVAGGLAGEALGDTYDSIENLWGSLFADTLTGDGGTNLIRGEDGNDTIHGGGGDDVLIGGNGADLFRFFDGDGVDRINGFLIGTDLIQITGAATQFADLTLGVFAGSATIGYDPGGTIVLSGIDVSLVTADLFVFA